MTQANGQGTRVDELVLQFIQLRDKVAEIKQAQKEHLRPYEEQMQRISGTLMKFLENTGQMSAKTAGGTVYISTKPNASLADPDTFMGFVIEEQQFELLNRSANATACMEYAKAHAGELPPGVNISTLRTLGVRAS